MENTESNKQANINQEPDKEKGYLNAFQEAFHRIWKNKYLWFWGIFLPSGFSLGLNFNYGANNSSGGDEKKIETAVEGFLRDNWQWLVLGVILFVILMVFWWTLSAISRAGVIRILDQLQNKEKPPVFKFSDVWKKGKKRYFQIIKLDVVMAMLVLAVIVALMVPTGFMFATHRIIAGSFLVIIGLLIFIPFIFLTIYVKNISIVFISLIRIGTIKSVEKAYNLAVSNLKEALKLLLVSLLLGLMKVVVIIGWIFAIGLAAAIAAVAIKFSMDNFINPVSMTLGGLLLLIFSLAMFLVHALFALWQQDLWIWWVKKIGGLKADIPEKTAREKARIAPVVKNTEPVVGTGT